MIDHLGIIARWWGFFVRPKKSARSVAVCE